MNIKAINRSLIAVVIVLCFFPVNAFCNNLEISDGTITSINETAGTALMKFNLSWENSWRDSINHDAVWLFVKYSVDGGDVWHHATLGGPGLNPEEFSAGTTANLEIAVPDDRKGCFLRRSWTGAGTVETDEVQLVWTYGIDGLSDGDMRNIGLKIFGIEMVYIPAGSFYAGDNGVSTASFTQGSNMASTGPWYVQSESAIFVTDNATGTYYYRSGGNAGEDATGTSFIIPDSFPKGYRAFYMMKYEITEQQWVDFFNMLTDAQKLNRDITGPAGKNTDSNAERNTVSWTEDKAVSQRPERAAGFLSWMDVTAYADWAALRPMTELEFEKAARGRDIAPLGGEYAWGTTGITGAAAISGDEDGTEIITTPGANSCFGDRTFTGGDGGKGPLRAGIFARTGTTRAQAGSGYYGAMELSGNLWERAVTVGNVSGRSFQGSHGDGKLSTEPGFEGNADISDWPGYYEGQGVSSAMGSGLKGGAYSQTVSSRQAISDRTKAARGEDARRADAGGRFVRTAP